MSANAGEQADLNVRAQGQGRESDSERPAPVRSGEDLRAIRHVLTAQAASLDSLAARHARGGQPDWRRLLAAAHELRLLVRSLPRQ